MAGRADPIPPSMKSNLKTSKVDPEQHPHKSHHSSSSNKPHTTTGAPAQDPLKSATSYKSTARDERTSRSPRPNNDRTTKDDSSRRERSDSAQLRNEVGTQRVDRPSKSTTRQMCVRTDVVKPRQFQQCLLVDSDVTFESQVYTAQSLRLESQQVRSSVRDQQNNLDRARVRVRWRLNAEGKIQSNARLVKWSDGSLGLFVGDSYFDLADKDITQPVLATPPDHSVDQSGDKTQSATTGQMKQGCGADTQATQKDTNTESKKKSSPLVTVSVGSDMLLSVAKVHRQLTLERKKGLREVRAKEQGDSQRGQSAVASRVTGASGRGGLRSVDTKRDGKR